MPSTALGFLVCRSRGWRVLAACEPTGAAFLGGDGLCIWNLTFGVARAARAACAFVSGLPAADAIGIFGLHANAQLAVDRTQAAGTGWQ